MKPRVALYVAGRATVPGRAQGRGGRRDRSRAGLARETLLEVVDAGLERGDPVSQLGEIALENLASASLVGEARFDSPQGLKDRLVLLLEPLEAQIDRVEVPEHLLSKVGDHPGESTIHLVDPTTDGRELASDLRESLIDSQKLLTDSRELLIDSEELLVDSQELLVDSEELLIDSQELLVDLIETPPQKLEELPVLGRGHGPSLSSGSPRVQVCRILDRLAAPWPWFSAALVC
jgi:hypothetical protein